MIAHSSLGSAAERSMRQTKLRSLNLCDSLSSGQLLVSAALPSAGQQHDFAMKLQVLEILWHSARATDKKPDPVMGIDFTHDRVLASGGADTEVKVR